MGSLFLVALLIFAVGSVCVVIERPGWSRVGFILECVGAVLAAVVALAQHL